MLVGVDEVDGDFVERTGLGVSVGLLVGSSIVNVVDHGCAGVVVKRSAEGVVVACEGCYSAC